MWDNKNGDYESNKIGKYIDRGRRRKEQHRGLRSVTQQRFNCTTEQRRKS